jgi:hypothetical protein
MFRLMTTTNSSETLASRALTVREFTPTTKCIPQRRRRRYKQITISTSETLRSTWF